MNLITGGWEGEREKGKKQIKNLNTHGQHISIFRGHECFLMKYALTKLIKKKWRSSIDPLLQ